jgi:transcriptional regulator with XRE-family HTH domain
MAKHIRSSKVGRALIAARRACYLSKTGLAQAAKVGRNTARRVEHGQASLKSFNQLADALGLELRGRGLPLGAIGPGLKFLRLRRHLTVARVAAMLESSSPTIKRLERGETTRLDVLEAYGELFGIDFYLAPKQR